MIEVNFYSKKYDKHEYGIIFETDKYALYEKMKDYLIEHIREAEREEVKSGGN